MKKLFLEPTSNFRRVGVKTELGLSRKGKLWFEQNRGK